MSVILSIGQAALAGLATLAALSGGSLALHFIVLGIIRLGERNERAGNRRVEQGRLDREDSTGGVYDR
jgi:hypothetical protein